MCVGDKPRLSRHFKLEAQFVPGINSGISLLRGWVLRELVLLRPAGFDLGLRNSGVHISGPESEISRPECHFAQ